MNTLNHNNESVNEQVLVDTFVKYRDQLVRILINFVNNKEDAQDAAQIAFMNCWKYRKYWSEVKDLKSWIFRIAVNVAKDIRKKPWSKRACQMIDEGDFLLSREVFSEEEEYKEKIAFIEKAILKLNKIDKQAFLFRWKHNLTCKQVAEKCNIPVGTAKTRIKRALDKIRKELNQPEFS